MPERAEGRQGVSEYAAEGLALLAAYVALAAFAHQFAVTPAAELSVWYPPAGILLAVLHRRGIGLWPFAILGEIVVGVVIYDIGEEFGAPLLVLNAVAVTGAYAAAAEGLRRLGVAASYRDRREVALLVVLGVVAAPLLAGMAGVAVQRWADVGLGEAYWSSVGYWAAGDAIGVAVLAPVTYRFLHAPVRVRPRAVTWLEAAAVVATPPLAFGLAGDQPYRYLFILALPVALVAVHHGVGVAAAAVVTTVSLTTVATSRLDGGTIGRRDLQVLLFSTAVLGNALGAIETMRNRHREHEQQLSALLDASPDLVAIVDASGGMTYLNPAGRRLLGDVGRLEDLLDGAAVHSALDRGTWRGSGRIARPDADDVRVSQLYVALPNTRRQRVGVVARDVTDLHRLTDQLTRSIFVDKLTGLANRARFLERVAFATGASGPGNHGVVLLDVDRFSDVNSALGHVAGDAMLRAVADRLADVTRRSELIARIGGDHFAVLVEDVPDTFAAVAAAERFRAAATGPVFLDGAAPVVKASAGVAVAAGGDDPDLVLRQADLALQRAKRSGGGRTVPYDDALATRLADRVRTEGVLRDALAGPRWPLRYQPIVDLVSGEVHGFEALLDPRIPPLEVVAVAEDLGLIGELGEQVLRDACSSLAGWRRRWPWLSVSVNASAYQLVDARLPGTIAAALEQAGVPAPALVLEVTETAFAADDTAAIDVAAKVRSLGVRVSIDDFGCGFSSLARLRSLPADELKVDRSFVADLGRVEGAEAIVVAIAGLARARGLAVVAEGVEDDMQRRALIALGCTIAQGWLIAKPMPAADVEGWLAARLSPRPATT